MFLPFSGFLRQCDGAPVVGCNAWPGYTACINRYIYGYPRTATWSVLIFPEQSSVYLICRAIIQCMLGDPLITASKALPPGARLSLLCPHTGEENCKTFSIL